MNTWWLVDCVTHYKEEFWMTAVGPGIQKKSRVWDPLQWRSAVIPAVMNNQSDVQFKPWWSNCETECSYYLTSYFNNSFHSTKILQLFMFCHYLLLLFLNMMMFAKLYIFVCGACECSFHLFFRGCVCIRSQFEFWEHRWCHQMPCLSVKEHKSLYVHRRVWYILFMSAKGLIRKPSLAQQECAKE